MSGRSFQVRAGDGNSITRAELRGELLRAVTLRQEGHLDRAAETFDRLIAVAHSLGEREIEGRATNGRGIVEERREQYQQAKQYYDRALEIATEIKDSIGAGLAHSDIAWIYQHWGMHEVAMAEARAALATLLSTPEEHAALHRMGTLLADSGHYHAALEFFEKAIASLQSAENVTPAVEIPLALNYAWCGSMQLHLGHPARAKEIHLKALEISERVGDRFNIANLTAKIGYCEMELGEPLAAQERLRVAADLNLALGRFSHVASCLMSIANLELRSGRPSDALTTLASASKYLEQSGSQRFQWRLHRTYAEAYSMLGDWRMVVHHDRQREQSRHERDSEQFRHNLRDMQILIATQDERHALEMQKLLAEKLSEQLLSLAGQAEMFDQFRQNVRNALRGVTDPINALQMIESIIRDLPQQRIDWLKFEERLTEIHPDFTQKLALKYPNLTRQQVRVCSLVRVGLQSPQISKLLSLSERTLENHRFNIRKKLALNTEDNLEEFLRNNI